MLSKEEVKHIAHLARIELKEKEVEKFQKELSAILDFVGQLTELDIPEVKTTKQIMELESVFKEDKEHGLVEEKGRELIDQAPQKKDGFVAVPKVIDTRI